MDDPQVIRNPNRPEAGADAGGARSGLAAAPAPATPPTLVFDEVAGELRRFVWGVVRDAARVDDVIQATYLKAIEKGSAAHPDTAKGWLFRVAYREALIVKRREAVQSRTNHRLAALPARDVPRPEESMIRAETVRAVRAAMNNLSEPQRRVVLARMHGDRTFAQIAAESNLPLGTVLTHMRRALEKMRRVLDLGE